MGALGSKGLAGGALCISSCSEVMVCRMGVLAAFNVLFDGFAEVRSYQHCCFSRNLGLEAVMTR